jgi:alcohol dehydrogenase class IV
MVPDGMILRTVRHRGDEPTLREVSDLIEVARQHQADWIAAIGGGSIMDLAKAATALIHAPHPPAHYHDGAALPDTGLVFIATPTTAGTGSEATLNSVLTNETTGVKKSIRSPCMMARVVILDPALLAGCPPAVVAASGMDALTQAIESYTSRNATWLSDTLALQAVRLIATHLEDVYRDSGSPGAGPLLYGSYLGGVALSFARLGVVHGLAHPLGALYHVPHGAVCAACLPHAVELNRAAFGTKYDSLSQTVGGDLLEFIRGLMLRLAMPSPFSGKMLREKDLIIRETLASGSTKANPKPITQADVEWLLEKLFS